MVGAGQLARMTAQAAAASTRNPMPRPTAAWAVMRASWPAPTMPTTGLTTGPVTGLTTEARGPVKPDR